MSYHQHPKPPIDEAAAAARESTTDGEVSEQPEYLVTTPAKSPTALVGCDLKEISPDILLRLTLRELEWTRR